EVLLMRAISLEIPCDRAWLYAHASDELRELWWIHYGRYLHERAQGKPTQYIVGHLEFYGRDFRVTPDVLIPRPETEHLIEVALDKTNATLNPMSRAARILDIGTGSGAIAVTLALETNARVFATDVSRAALKIAASNALKLAANVAFIECDLGSAFAGSSFDIVASNPPYVPERDRSTLAREVRDHEPALALFAGDDGLSVYRGLIPDARRLLVPGGWLIMELGHDSLAPVHEMLAGWNEIEVVSDLAGIPRVIAAQKPR
ncbi:MAG TPA: peptide chain release factor N(5)-glutamine methyltransferase, partial [Polyangiaceae bacterium]|nr:peptide chain release factor N(5)-glutamine methyltransferase [Polyangiaceae bacterium]